MLDGQESEPDPAPAEYRPQRQDAAGVEAVSEQASGLSIVLVVANNGVRDGGLDEPSDDDQLETRFEA